MVRRNKAILTAASAGLRFWRDLDEQGQAGVGEIGSVDRVIASGDYALYTRGNARIAPVQFVAPNVNAMPTAPVRPASSGAMAPMRPFAPISFGFSNYRSLRDGDNRYYLSNGWIDWNASQIKINSSNKTYLIGTDGNDALGGGSRDDSRRHKNSDLMPRSHPIFVAPGPSFRAAILS